MRAKSKQFSKRSRRGLTLVEAVIGTAMLGTMLVAILMAGARLQVQAARAERRVLACRIADELLEKWWTNPEEFRRGGEGPVLSHEGWTWRTRVLENKAARRIGAEVVALEVLASDGAQNGPAVRLEILLPEKADAEEGGTDAD